MREKYDITIREGIQGAKPRKNARKEKHREVSWFYLGLVGQIGYTIALPLVLGALGGAYIDRLFLTRPTFTIAGLGIGFIISIAGFVRTIRDALRSKV